MKAKVLYAYLNGNTIVTLYDDGTKTREFDDDVAKPIFPETIDLKITDYCDAGCGYCHEKSTKGGQHASTAGILRLVEGLPMGTELAVGGGDPLSHPDILEILLQLKERGMVVNLTINALHVGTHTKFVRDLRKMELIFGLGVSYQPKVDISHIVDNRTIIHVIAGVHDIKELNDIPKAWPLLVLGYKF